MASPTAAAVASMRVPGCAKERVAVTITMMPYWTCITVGFTVTLHPL